MTSCKTLLSFTIPMFMFTYFILILVRARDYPESRSTRSIAIFSCYGVYDCCFLSGLWLVLNPSVMLAKRRASRSAGLVEFPLIRLVQYLDYLSRSLTSGPFWPNTSLPYFRCTYALCSLRKSLWIHRLVTFHQMLFHWGVLHQFAPVHSKNEDSLIGIAVGLSVKLCFIKIFLC